MKHRGTDNSHFYWNGDCISLVTILAGCQKVQGIVNRSDYVVFITSTNSHATLRVTKTFCKKKYKKFITLKQRGGESLERTLRQASMG